MAEADDRYSAYNYALAAVLTPILSVVHFGAATWLSYVLFGLAGGIESDGRWTRYGGIDYAWTNLAWLPGGLLLSADGPFAAIGALFMFAGSCVAGYTLAAAVGCLASGVRPRFGRRAWRLWLTLVLWLMWVPVPVKSTITYWHTIAY